MKVAVEEIGACKRRLQVEEVPEVVQDAWNKAFKRVQKEARLPGFRKGKVPPGMIKLHFADDIRQDVARHPVARAKCEQQVLRVGAALRPDPLRFLERRLEHALGARSDPERG